MNITPSLTLLSAQQQPGEASASDKAQPGSVNIFLNEPEQTSMPATRRATPR